MPRKSTTPRLLTDADMIANPLKWPQWPWLPVKRRSKDGPPDCALVYADDSTELIHANLWALKTTDFKTVKRTKYDSVDAMVADGWVVD